MATECGHCHPLKYFYHFNDDDPSRLQVASPFIFFFTEFSFFCFLFCPKIILNYFWRISKSPVHGKFCEKKEKLESSLIKVSSAGCTAKDGKKQRTKIREIIMTYLKAVIVTKNYSTHSNQNIRFLMSRAIHSNENDENKKQTKRK